MTPHQDPAIPALPLSETLALAIKLGIANVDFEEQAEIDGFLQTFGNSCREAGYAAGQAAGVQGEAATMVKNIRLAASELGDMRIMAARDRANSDDVAEAQQAFEIELAALAALYTAPQAETLAVAEGFVLVPREPTEAMKLAGGHVNSEWLNDNAPIGERRYVMPMEGVWAAMLAAAPTPTASTEPWGTGLLAREELANDGHIGAGPSALAAPKAEGEAVTLRNPRMEPFDREGPLPGMIAAFETQFGQSWTDKDWRDEASTWARAWKAALATTAARSVVDRALIERLADEAAVALDHQVATDAIFRLRDAAIATPVAQAAVGASEPELPPLPMKPEFTAEDMVAYGRHARALAIAWRSPRPEATAVAPVAEVRPMSLREMDEDDDAGNYEIDGMGE